MRSTMFTGAGALAGLAGMLGLALAGCAAMNAEPPPAQEAKPGLSEREQPDEAEKPRSRRERSAKLAPAEGKASSECGSGRMVRSAFYWQGRRTASGQPFNPEGMTAAHRTLPFGTQLTVTNPRTGKSVTVVVNDRGPFTPGLHLDLSRGAARAIGLTGTGSVCVS